MLMCFMKGLSIKNGMYSILKNNQYTYLIYITIFYSHRAYEGKVWAGLHSLKERNTAPGRIKQRKFTKDDVSFYESKNHIPTLTYYK